MAFNIFCRHCASWLRRMSQALLIARSGCACLACSTGAAFTSAPTTVVGQGDMDNIVKLYEALLALSLALFFFYWTLVVRPMIRATLKEVRRCCPASVCAQRCAPVVCATDCEHLQHTAQAGARGFRAVC